MKQAAILNKMVFSMLLLIMSFNLFSQTIPPYVPTNGLVGWWPFNGNANDESGHGNNGTVNGATPALDRFGNANSAYDFNGTSNFIEINSNPSIEPNLITVSVWYNTPINDLQQMMIGKSNYVTAASEMYSFHLALAAIKRLGTCVSGIDWYTDSLQSTLVLNEWQHAVFTWDGNLLKTYLNGNLINQITAPSGTIDNCPGGSLRFGVWWLQNQRWFHGKLDDIGIWNRALSACEINQLFKASTNSSNCFDRLPSGLPSNGLVAWYPFTGNANDSSGNGNNGTVHGATPTTDRFGNLNSAYNFNGTTNYISGSCTNFPATARTVSLWYNGTSIGIGIPPGKSVFGYGGLVCGESWIQVIDTNYYSLSMHCNNNWSQYYAGAIQNNSWHHWLVTNDGVSQTKFYIDGQLVYDTSNYYNNTYVSGRDFAIGGLPSPTGFGLWIDQNVEPFTGKIDDVAIYNRVLNACEILQLYIGYKIILTSQPSNVNVNTGSNAQFTVSTSNNQVSYQWQTDSAGSGYHNIYDGAKYAGTSNDTLFVNNVSMDNNNQRFRCIISSPGYCTDTSSAALLTVTNILAMRLLSFNVLKEGKKATLNWAVEKEESLSYYSIERSNDGENFYSIGRLASINTSGVHTYRFSDESPISGFDFYRLKMMEANGNFSYSPIRKINFENANLVIIYPNPSNGKFMVDFGKSVDSKTYSIVIRNVLSQKVFETKTSQQKIEIKLKGQTKKGIYFVEIKNEAQEIVGFQKVFIQ